MTKRWRHDHELSWEAVTFWHALRMWLTLGHPMRRTRKPQP